MKEFEYFAPNTLNEAISLAEQCGANSHFLAGGTDLIVEVKQRITYPSHVINLKRITELSEIRYSSKNELYIGPLVTHNDLAEHQMIQKKYLCLAEAASSIGTFQIRERGTIGGNICHGSPAADTVSPLICLDAKLKLQGTGKERAVSIEDFFVGPQETDLKVGEVLSQIEIPSLPPNTGTAHFKLGMRKALEIAIVGVAALITLDQNKEICVGARISLASVAPTPLRCRAAEAILVGQELEDEIFERAARAAQEAVRPISDLRSSAEYRREMVYALTKRVLGQASRRALGSHH
jgi:carbon-monoxide dehydrogenase medium subunit